MHAAWTKFDLDDLGAGGFGVLVDRHAQDQVVRVSCHHWRVLPDCFAAVRSRTVSAHGRSFQPPSQFAFSHSHQPNPNQDTKHGQSSTGLATHVSWIECHLLWSR